ncbi:hypothetical protein Tco_0510907 [Tanacetum coccineum]
MKPLSFTKFSTNIIDLQSFMNALQAHALKQDEELAAWAKSSTNMAWNLSFRLSGLERAQTHIQSSMSSLKEDTHSIKTMMTKMYEVFKGQSSGSVTLTLALTYIPANVKGENETNTTTEEPHTHTEGETKDPQMAIPISSIQPTEVPPPQAQPITTKTTHSESSQAAPRIDKGKGIATESDEDPSKKLVSASTIVRPDPNEEVKVPYMINGKMCYLTDKEMQAYLDKEEKLRKAAEEARLLAISSLREFGISELVELRDIIPKKKNAVVQDLMNLLSRRTKRKHMELEPEIKIPGLECNQALPENFLFVNNMVIEEPEYGIFFTDEFGDQAFQRWSDINKVGMEALVSYLVAASMVQSPENARFSMKLKKLIPEHPDQEKLKPKKVKLEALGYEMN